MPINLSAARKEKREQFFTQFGVSKLPYPDALIAFLSQYGMSCFLEENAAMQHISIEKDATVEKIIFCLPVSESIADDFIAKLAELMRRSTCNVILYFPRRLPEVNIALRIDIQRVGGIAHISSTILYPSGMGDYQAPIDEFASKLGKHIAVNWTTPETAMEKQVLCRVGDEGYWAALSLFLDLSQTDQRYQQAFIRWQATQQKTLQSAQQEAVQLLHLVTYLYPPLYYGEQSRLIFAMPLVQQRLHYPCPPAWINDYPIKTTLDCLVLAFMIYQGDYFVLPNLLLIYGLNKLSKRVTNVVEDSRGKITLFYLCQLFVFASRMAFTFYMALPETAIERSIVAPRYLFSWLAGVMEEGVKLSIKLFGLISFYCGMNACLSESVLADPGNEAGFFAIAILLLEGMMPLLGACLPRFSGWQKLQFAEEEVLHFLGFICQRDHCTLNIETSLIWRLLQQALFSEQVLQITATNENRTQRVECEFNISTAIPDAPTVQSPCFSQLFYKALPSAIGRESLYHKF